ncbi:Mucin-associated surface protein (MASP) [Trypanosoma cruzi]|uniref:Mucin-associated surface protein (MASP), putative n=2 Tax=Trypanosoma cruzi TaxID=5693 RepID=Q4E1B0_TRYCC|nr:mucin-associated surface protein (MASP), putative [Trypanosoma cruzi]EAN98556.1 mucin-associated surface protein (MASP), putative [Trypanosoma cruzi]PWV17821.1 Mucin-associated surface protein (MASP) [Trypanosoma cruzi]RNC41811.1 mucin-associated surface protein (MASP) [Trypanosoma cruzi]|eukprot:XP_820407.1 mucin-associated surface protein (MASP) [Trypanosoma cruzi strain CL Brener]
MAMMSGRVLLVCALCVLWCGAGGRCDEEGTAGHGVQPGVSASGGSGAPDNASGQTASGVAVKPSAEQTQLRKAEDSAPGSPQSQADLQNQSSTIQRTPSSSENAVPSTHSKPSGEQMQDLPEEVPPGKPEILSSQEEGKNETIANQQSIDPPSHSGNNDVVGRNSGERTDDTPSSTEIIDAAPSEEVQEREKVTPSLEQPQETSTAAPAITTQTTSMTPPKDGENSSVKMSDASPHSTVTVTQTNHTATITQNSDSSTAVFHCTSPLLLLLVVACAAAAAVVAA